MGTTANRALRFPDLLMTANVPARMEDLANDVDGWLARVRSRRTLVATASLTNGGTVATLVVPAAPVAQRVSLSFLGHVGFSAAASQNVGINVATSTGTWNSSTTGAYIRVAEAGQWYAYVASGYVDLPASTGVTFTVTAFIVGGSNSYFRGELSASSHFAGEYA